MGSEAAPPPTDAEELGLFLHPDERSLNVRITWKQADPGLRASLLQALQQHGCFVTEEGPEEVASVDYRVWKRQETKQVGKVRKLLTRWAERGYLAWTSQRLTPPPMARRSSTRSQRSARKVGRR